VSLSGIACSLYLRTKRVLRGLNLFPEIEKYSKLFHIRKDVLWLNKIQVPIKGVGGVYAF
jgi:hypothetical protein